MVHPLSLDILKSNKESIMVNKVQIIIFIEKTGDFESLIVIHLFIKN